MALLRRFPVIPSLLFALAPWIIGGCDSTDSGDSGTSSSRGPVTALVLDKTVSGTFQGMTYSMDFDTIPFVIDSGWTYRIVVATTEYSFQREIIKANGDDFPFELVRGTETEQQIDTLVVLGSHRDTLRMIISGVAGTTYSATLLRTEGIPKGSFAADAFEMDDSRTSARKLVPDSGFQNRTLHGSGARTEDQDYIAIPCVAGRAYQVRLSGEGDYDPEFEIVKPDGIWLVPSVRQEWTKDSRWELSRRFVAQESRPYFVTVDGSWSLAYRISVVTESDIPSTTSADAFESDDLSSQARPIPTDGTWQSRNLRLLDEQTTDVDWLTFHADSGRTYIIHTRNDRELQMRLIHPDTLECDYLDSSRWEDWEWHRYKAFSTHRSGTFRLEVKGYPDSWYKIAVESKPGMLAGEFPVDPWENDNSRDRAKMVATDSSVQHRTFHTVPGWSSVSEDVDWVRFEADSGFVYKLVVDGMDRSQVVIYDEDTTTPLLVKVAPEDKEYATRNEFTLPSGRKGSYQIRLDADRESGSYDLAISRSRGIDSTQVQDRFEPDNSLLAASHLASDGNWQQRTIHLLLDGESDPDHLVFAVDSGKLYSFRSEGGDKLLTYSFRKNDSVFHYVVDTTIDGVRTFLLPAVEDGKCHVTISAQKSVSYRVALSVAVGLPAWGALEEGEPDHGMASAFLLPDTAREVNRAIVANDTDWTGIRLRKGFQYKFFAKTIGTHILYMSFWDSARRSGWSSNYVDSKGSTWMVEPNVDKTYFLYAAVYRGQNALRLPYHLEYEALPIPGDSMEDDPDISHPSRLAVDSASAMRATRKGDNDWMRIDVESGRRLAVMFKHHGNPDGGSPWIRFELRSADGTQLQSSILSRPGEGDTLFHTASQSGPVFMHVTGDDEVTNAYSIGAELLPTDVNSEYSWATAGVIPEDGSWNRRVATLQRWMKFPTKKGEAYRIDWVSEKETHVNLFDEDSVYLEREAYCRSATLLVRAKTDGWMYLMTEGGGSGFAFKAALSRLPNDSDEPANDSLAGARPIKADSSVVEGLLVPDERDVYSFDAIAGKRYTVRVLPEGIAGIGFWDSAAQGNPYVVGQNSFVARESGASAFFLDLAYYGDPGPYTVTLVESTDDP